MSVKFMYAWSSKKQIKEKLNSLTRRHFMQLLGKCSVSVLAAGAGFSWRFSSQAPEVIKIGHIALCTRSIKAAGEAATSGARLGRDEAAWSAELFGSHLEFTSETVSNPAEAVRTARELVEEKKVDILVGSIEDPIVLEISEFSHQKKILFFNAGSSIDALRGKRCQRSTFSVTASTAMYVDAIGQWLVQEAGLHRWFFVTPDSPQGQGLYNRACNLLKKLGGEELGNGRVPRGKQNFDSIFQAISKAGAEVAFINLTGIDQINFVTQYRQLNPSFEIAGPLPEFNRLGEAGVSSAAGMWPVLWHHSLFKYGADQLNMRFKQQFYRSMDSLSWVNWAAVMFATEAVLKAGGTDTKKVIPYLEEKARFDSRKGIPLTFRNWDHQLRQILYIAKPKELPESPGDMFQVVGEVPAKVPGQYASVEEALDQIGLSRAETPCRFEPLEEY